MPTEPAAPQPPVTPAPGEPAPAEPVAPTEPAPAEPAAPSEGAEDLGSLEGAAKIKQGITGRLIDASTGEPVIEGQVQVTDRPKKTLSDLDGYFSLSLPPGTYSLRAFYELYEPQRLDNIVVKKGEVTNVEIKLGQPAEAAVKEEVIVVTARADTATEATQLEARKSSTAVRDNISAQEIQRSGANNAADAVRRVVSATIDPNNRLIVRGLGSRYTRVLLRGFRIPGTDPDDPGVQLDLFPAGVLANLSVIKTFTPDLPGDFAGGVMQIETRDFPKSFLLQTSLSLGYNTQTTFRSLPGYEGGKLDFLGFDDGGRSLPSAVPNRGITTAKGIPADSFTPPEPLEEDEVKRIGDSFNSNYKLTDPTALPNMTGNLVVGDTVKLGKKDLGYLAALGYQNKTDIRDSRFHESGLMGGRVTPISNFRDQAVRRQALIGALTTFNLELTPTSDLSLTSLFSQSGSSETNFAEGLSADAIRFQQRRLRWVERQLFFTQLRGQHRDLPKLHKLTIDWNLNVARAGRQEPDTRTIRYSRVDATSPYQFTFNQRSPGRFFSELAEWTLGSQTDFALPIIDPLKLKVGHQTRHSWSDFDSRRFLWVPQTINEMQLQLPPEQLLSGANRDLFLFQEGTKTTDGYRATSSLYAGYAMAEVTPIEPLKLIGGARIESLSQDLRPYAPTATASAMSTGPTRVQNTLTDVLPAGATVITVMKDMFVRASYGQTVARPLLRELAPFVYEDDVRRLSISGNPNLDRSLIHNVDLRWEMYPKANEVLAVTGFYKLFNDPIEPVQLNQTRTFQNAKGAQNVGFELESRLSLGRIQEKLRDFQLGANFTYVYSRVEIERVPGEVNLSTSTNRPLAGQSPYVANLSLGFSKPDNSASVFLYYNVFGKRIDQVGANGLPDQYELPFHSLDLIGSYSLDSHWSLRANAKNLAFRSTRIKEGPVMRERFNPGTIFTVGAAWSY